MQAPTKVLIADDSRITRTTLRVLLGDQRDICEVENGLEALALYEMYRPDIILLDINMPGMDGTDIIQKIRNRYHDQDTFIIVLTGEQDPELQTRTLNLGANDFLNKPFERTELIARVGVAERQVQLTQQLRRYTHQIQQEIEHVASLQARLLPHQSPLLPGVHIESEYRPSGKASGDYFDYFPIGENGLLRLVTADVSGHGARAAFIMGIVRTLFRISRKRYLPLEDTIGLVNEHLLEIIGDEDDFVTIFAADIDFSNNSINYINAGHCPGMLREADGTIHRLNPNMPLIGFFDIHPVMNSIRFSKSSSLLLFTDGLYDWHLPEGGLYDFSMFWELAAKTLERGRDVLPELIDTLIEKAGGVSRFRDDITALLVHRDM